MVKNLISKNKREVIHIVKNLTSKNKREVIHIVKNLTSKNKRPLLTWLVGLSTLAWLAIYILYSSITISKVLNFYSFLTPPNRHTITISNSPPPSINLTAQPYIPPFVPSNMSTKLPFYGENIDMSQILPASQNYVVNSKGEDLIDIAANLGINLIRLTNAQRSFNNTMDSIYTTDQWYQVLNKMQSKGIKAIILIEVASNNGDYYTPDIRPVYLHLVQEYVDSEVFLHPDVYAVDIKNEPILTDANVAMLQEAHAMIKAKYPSLQQTVGSWATAKHPNDPYNPANYNWSDFAAGQRLADIVDIYSLHMYGLSANTLGVKMDPDLKTKIFLAQAQSGLQTQKPILIEEFGEANGSAVSDQDTIGSPELQARVYQGVYQALQEIHSSQIIGSVAFDFYSRNQYSDAWAIAKNNGDYLFPAAYVLQQYALDKITAHLQILAAPTSNSYLLTNANNHVMKNLHVADRIGLKLQLNNSQHYSLTFSTPGILQPTDLLHYNPVSASYYAVYQAASKGTVQLSIITTSHNAAGLMHTTPIYTITITVQ